MTIAITIGQGMRVTQGHLSMHTHMSIKKEEEEEGKKEYRKKWKTPFSCVDMKLSKDEKKEWITTSCIYTHLKWILIFHIHSYAECDPLALEFSSLSPGCGYVCT